MPLNSLQKNKMSELDVRSGGLVESESKTQAGERKALIIGLGGMGGRVISRIKTELTRRVNYNNSQIRLLAIDSDMEDLKSIESDSPGRVHLDPDFETFQIFFDNANQVLLLEDARPAFYKKWLNINFACRMDGHGAGQVRQAGRALFLGNNFGALKQRIDAGIRSLCGERVLRNLDVYIAAGISGGTGSGSFIDMPNIVRQVFSERGGDLNDLKIMGYMLLPSVMYGIDNLTDISKISFESNGYAALKELDYYMSIPYRCGNSNLYDEKFEYPTGNPVYLKQLDSLYDLCTLISGSVGGKVVKNVDSYAVDVTAESIINMLIDTQEEKTADDGTKQMASFHIGKSFLDNVDRQSSILDEGPPEDPIFARDACYKYCTSGVGTASIPNAAMVSYAGASVITNLLKVNMRKNDKVSVDTVRTFVVNSLISPIQMFNTIVGDRSYQIIPEEGLNPTYRDVSECNTAEFELFIEQSKLKLANTRSKLVSDALGRAISNFDTYCYKHLQSSGPYSLVQIFEMYREPNNNSTCEGILQNIRGYKASLETKITELENSKAKNIEQLTKLTKDATKAGALKKGIKFLNSRDHNRYIDCSLEDARISLKIDAAARLKDEIQTYIDHVTEFADHCKILTEVLDETEKLLSNSAERFKQNVESGLRYNYNLIDPKDNTAMFEWVKAKLDTAIGTVNMAKLQHDIVEDFTSNRNDWVAVNHEFNANNKMKNILNQAFTQPVKITIGDYFEERLRRENIDGLRKEVGRICDAVEEMAQPLFGFIPTYPVVAKEISNRYIIVPDDMNNTVKAEFRAYADRKNMQLAFSKASNQIAFYNLIAGIPLYADRFMTDYESTYLKRNASWQHMNERLSDTENLTWRNYPPIISSTIWKAMPGYENAVERSFLQNIFKPLMDKARKIGIFARQDEGYAAKVINENEGFAQNFANRLCATFPNPNQIIPTGTELFNNLFNAAANKYTLPVTLQKKSIENPTSDDEKDFENICVIIRRHVPLYLKIKNTVKMYEKAEEIIDNRNRGILYKSAVGDFLNVVGSGRIYEDTDHCWRISLSAMDTQILFDLSRAVFMPETRRFSQSDLIHYAIFKGFLDIEAEKKDKVCTGAIEYLRNCDIKEFSSRRAPFIEAARVFNNRYGGVVNAMEKESLEREIGAVECEKASVFYQVCLNIGA